MLQRQDPQPLTPKTAARGCLLFFEIIGCDFLNFIGDDGIYTEVKINHQFSRLAAIYKNNFWLDVFDGRCDR